MLNSVVVTRTKSRPQLLMRAVDSVCAQTVRDFTWVIVNDGGDEAPAEQAAATARARGVNTILLHQGVSRGMEAASNSGVSAASSRYVAIHDDDDSWAPEFLERTTTFLAANPEYAGVTTHCTRIEEKMEGHSIREIRRSPHMPVLNCVHLGDMLQRNLFPPIALLYRRSVFDAVGGYDESMAILGDWDFNIKLLMHGDIAVLSQPLAFYHVRVGATPSSSDQNSILPGASRQQIADAAYRNRMLRRDVAEGRVSLGLLLTLLRPAGRVSVAGRLIRWFKG